MSVFYRPPTYVCNKYLPRKHSRASTCEVETEECCDGHTLKNGFCIPDDQIGTSSTTNSDENTGPTTNGGMNYPNDVTQEPGGWEEWSPWSACTATCGGCGKKARTRACLDSSSCGQKTDSQTQVCNTQPCPNYQAYACPHITVEEYNCGWLINCTRTKTEMRECVTRCCPHYEEKNGVCVPVSSSRKRKRRK